MYVYVITSLNNTDTIVEAENLELSHVCSRAVVPPPRNTVESMKRAAPTSKRSDRRHETQHWHRPRLHRKGVDGKFLFCGVLLEALRGELLEAPSTTAGSSAERCWKL